MKTNELPFHYIYHMNENIVKVNDLFKMLC